MRNEVFQILITVICKCEKYKFTKKVHAQTNPKYVEVDFYDICHKHYPLFFIIFNKERKFNVEFSIDHVPSKNYEISYEKRKANLINCKFNAVLRDYFESVKEQCNESI